MLEKALQSSFLKSIIQDFPGGIKYSFAYGSGAFKQKTGDPASNMLDLIFVVDKPSLWHAVNLRKNPDHYAQPLRRLGHEAIARYQESFGARVYYNTLVTTSEGRNIKYGVVSDTALIEDLLDWNYLYLAGRLHKPVKTIIEADEKSAIKTALNQNLQSAIHVALLLLPEHFSEVNLYKRVASLSYNGDFRMIFGEDKDKVSNIVEPQMQNFRKLYAPILQNFENYMDVPTSSDRIPSSCRQDTSPIAKIHHLNHLPKAVQLRLVRAWLQGKKRKDAEDCFRAIAHDIDCDTNVDIALRNIVWNSSVSQSLKGILTAGLFKSVVYSWRKVRKMMASVDVRESARKVIQEVQEAVKKVQTKDSSK